MARSKSAGPEHVEGLRNETFENPGQPVWSQSAGKLKRFVATILSLGFLFAVPIVSAAATSSGPRSEWEKAVEAAKKEGQLTVYHWGTSLMLDAGAFQKAYPEIKVTTVSAMGTELMQRILAERRGDRFIPDVYIAGIASMVVLHKAKVFDPIKNALMLPDVSDALLNRASHPNAARIFINWFLSREGQDLFQKLQINANDPADSLRIDIARNQIPSADRRQDGVKYIDLDEHKVFDATPAIRLIKETLGEIGN